MRNLVTFTALAIETTAASRLWASSSGVPGVNASYDYVVVGGGTAGLTVAARLAEDASVSVAVIEAGGFYEIENGIGSVVPGLATTQFVGSDPDDTRPLIDWGFVTTPQEHQMWADEVGDQSYIFDNVLKYFQRSVHLTPPNANLRPSNATVQYDANAFSNSATYHQPLQVSWSNFVNTLETWTYQALGALGVKVHPEGFESGNILGSSFVPSTIDPKTAHRSSSQTSFLEYAMADTSLKVYTRALARQIMFSPNKTANGVLVQSGTKNFTVSAAREVILSAGAFQSPQLLMVSGIGPGQTLQEHGISVISDLPGVGQNLWDQFWLGIQYRVNVPTGSKFVNDPAYAAAATAAYIANASGPLNAGPGMITFEKLSSSHPEAHSNSTLEALKDFPSDWPEIVYLTLSGATGLNRNYQTVDPADGYNYATLGGVVTTPFSRSNVTISSSDASVQPVINPNWMATPEDEEPALVIFKRLRQLWSQMSNVTIGSEYLPGANVTTDEQILDYIREESLTLYHASATCKMGMKNDTKAVVDPQARVYGVHGLRVVDASAFPFLPPGHPQATLYMLAEKIADDIKYGHSSVSVAEALTAQPI